MAHPHRMGAQRQVKSKKQNEAGNRPRTRTHTLIVLYSFLHSLRNILHAIHIIFGYFSFTHSVIHFAFALSHLVLLQLCSLSRFGHSHCLHGQQHLGFFWRCDWLEVGGRFISLETSRICESCGSFSQFLVINLHTQLSLARLYTWGVAPTQTPQAHPLSLGVLPPPTDPCTSHHKNPAHIIRARINSKYNTHTPILSPPDIL